VTDASEAPRHDPVATLRHDLRTPLNQIIGYSELLQEDALDAGQDSIHADLGKILNASRHLLGMINKVIEPAQIQLLKELPDLKHLGVDEPTHPNLISSADLALVLPKLEAAPVAPMAPEAGAKATANILVVDDDPQNCDLLARRLVQEGYAVFQAYGGIEALEKLRGSLAVDVVLLDVLMPDLGGFEVLVQIKNDEALRHIPVIMISALDQLDSVVRCIQNGADDYLGKPFNLTFLRARLGSSLERKRLRDQEQEMYQTLKKTQDQLVEELAEASAYVRTQLPELITGQISTQWEFVSSSSLGGDAFGYRWIDEHCFSMYLLDVCGHGVGAALLSIAALNTIGGQALPGVDFKNPSQVLAALNSSFTMERHNNMYFTMWYGIYDSRTGMLTYGSAGHPPAFLFEPGNVGEPVQLRTPNLFIGGLPDVEFATDTHKVPPGSRLYVLSDGVYEIRRPNLPMMSLTDLADFLRAQPPDSTTVLKDVWNLVYKEHGGGILEDDFSIMEFRFS
jgi:sigma-B regulation protein RsbU (phosphoserine phosphatase)